MPIIAALLGCPICPHLIYDSISEFESDACVFEMQVARLQACEVLLLMCCCLFGDVAGCGLPPGPGGGLGALEGLSYLTLLGVVAWSIGMKATSSRGLPAGPGGVLGIAEGLSYLTLTAGAIVLGLQVCVLSSKCYT